MTVSLDGRNRRVASCVAGNSAQSLCSCVGGIPTTHRFDAGIPPASTAATCVLGRQLSPLGLQRGGSWMCYSGVAEETRRGKVPSDDGMENLSGVARAV